MKKITWVLMLGSVIFFPGCGADEEPRKEENKGKEPRIKLIQKFQPGTYEIVSKVNISTKTKVKKRSFNQNQTITTTMELVAGRPDGNGNTTYTIRYKRMIQSISGAGISKSYDTDNPRTLDDPQVGAIFRALLTAKMVMDVDFDGNIIDFQGMGEMWDKIAKDKPELKAMAIGMKNQMGADYIKQNLLPYSNTLPDYPVGEGAVWWSDTELTIPMAGKAAVQLDCEFNELTKTTSGTHAKISYSGKCKSDSGESMDLGVGTASITKMDLKQSGDFDLNVESGMINAGSVNQKGSMEMKMSVNGETMNMTIDLDSSTTTTIKKIK